MKTTRRMRAASLLAVAALGLSACGAVEDLTGGSDETPGQQEEGGAETDGTGSDGDDNDSDDGDDSNDADVDNGGSTSLTAPSTELQVGDTATIPQGKEGGTVTVTVSKITKGSFSDLAHLKDVDEYKDYTPVYVEYTATGTDQSNQLQYRMLEGFYPVLTDGRKAGSLVIFGTQKFEKCDSNSFPKGFGAGQVVTDCDIALLADGQELGGAMFQPYKGDYTDDGKIVWKN